MRGDIFVIGVGRSGTSWVQRCLGAHPEIATSQETHLFAQFLAPAFTSWHVDVNRLGDAVDDPPTRRLVGLSTVLTRAEFDEWATSLLDRCRANVLAADPQATRYLDKSPRHGLQVDLIDRLSPGAQFVHVIRDPRDVVASQLGAEFYTAWRDQGLDALARNWEHVFSAARSAARFGPDRYHEVRYDEMTADPRSAVGRLCRFLGVAVPTPTQLDAMIHAGNDVYHVVGEAAVRGHRTVHEPADFDIRTRPPHPPLSGYDRWRVLHQAPSARALGISAEGSPVVRVLHRLRWSGRQVVRWPVRAVLEFARRAARRARSRLR